ncbi:hypothetical protein FRC10_003923 [Ceratobasidium sp. 414]|nr:hypothetical protein FRC10_003923 [Ceratobasidium sp. 414]
MNTFLSAFLLSAVAVSAAPSLVLDVTGPPSAVDINGLVVQTTLRNVGDVPLRLLNSPNSVLSTFETETFTISSASGSSPAFTGIRVKYSPASAAASNDGSAFTILAPGQSVGRSHSLAGVYNFTQSGEGLYTFGASNIFDYVDSSGSLGTISAVSNPHEFQIAGRLAAPNTALPKLSKRNDYKGCDSKQLADIEAAASESNIYVAQAVAYFASNPNPDPTAQTQYTEWFGTYDNQRYRNVASHFDKIGGQASTNDYDCTCTEAGVFAYVYPDQPGAVYLCPAFWTAPVTGTDSRAGTIVHENSHFVINGGTKDYAYGQANCRKLAANNPGQAAQNADNHEYFVETMPSA